MTARLRRSGGVVLYSCRLIPRAQTLREATLHAVQALAREAELGSVEVGKRAALVLVGGNPSGRIEDMRRVALVAKGRRVCVDRIGAASKA